LKASGNRPSTTVRRRWLVYSRIDFGTNGAAMENAFFPRDDCLAVNSMFSSGCGGQCFLSLNPFSKSL
jgi:hypothetical protein